MGIALFYLSAITAAELVTALVSTSGGLIFHMVLLCSFILGSFIADKHSSHKLYLALALAPLMRIVSLSIPLSQFTQIYWYLFISIPLLIAIIITIRVLNFRLPEVGLSMGNLLPQGAVALTGIGFGLIEYYICKPDPLIDKLTWGEILLPALVLLVATSFVEELAFRGIMQRSSIEVLGPQGWMYIAVLSSVLYIGYLSAMHWFVVFLVGLFFGWIVKRTGSLLGVTLSHGIINISLYLVIPLVA